MNEVVGACDIALVTLDTLRFDVAAAMFAEGRLPNFAAAAPHGWERRHAPGNFTYASHHAFFAGFLPTPVEPGLHPRLFAAAFEGSETTADTTYLFSAATLPEGLAAAGYRTICAGGVGFFNGRTALGRVLPAMFDEAHWSPRFGVTDRDSTENQFRWVADRIARRDERVFAFVNVSAIHQPNCGYVADREVDDLETHGAALCYVDAQLPIVFDALRARGRAFVIVCSDHGTAYGEDGYVGHRLAHPSVWDVPYAHFFLEAA